MLVAFLAAALLHLIVQYVRASVLGQADSMGGLSDSYSTAHHDVYILAFLSLGVAMRSRFFWTVSLLFFCVQVVAATIGFFRWLNMEHDGLAVADWVALLSLIAVDVLAVALLLGGRTALISPKADEQSPAS